MKASKFSEAQIAFVLKQANDGTAVDEVCRKAGVSQATFYSWRGDVTSHWPSGKKSVKHLATSLTPLPPLRPKACRD